MKHPPELAYNDPTFLEGEDGRPLRILAEYLEPLARFEREGVKDTVVFFGSARLAETGPLARYYREARALAAELTAWTRTTYGPNRYVVCSGGGGGIMEAANRGALDAQGLSVGLNIDLPHEQMPNAYISERLSFRFRYFFMRKLWLAHLARALIAFPGGFGTLDELFELLALDQTHKLEPRVPILLYGTSYWREIINFEALVRHGMIDAEDVARLHFVDSPGDALLLLQRALPRAHDDRTPALARSRGSDIDAL